jgi:hypothetical protein
MQPLRRSRSTILQKQRMPIQDGKSPVQYPHRDSAAKLTWTSERMSLSRSIACFQDKACSTPFLMSELAWYTRFCRAHTAFNRNSSLGELASLISAGMHPAASTASCTPAGWVSVASLWGLLNWTSDSCDSEGCRYSHQTHVRRQPMQGPMQTMYLHRGEVQHEVADGSGGCRLNCWILIHHQPEEGWRHIGIHQACPQGFNTAREASHTRACCHSYLQATNHIILFSLSLYRRRCHRRFKRQAVQYPIALSCIM